MNTAFLLADDDIDDAYLFQVALKKAAPAVKCHIAENGGEVFEVLHGLADDRPDFIFLDINMPKMDGWDCLKKLKGSEAFSQIPAIMYSTSSAKRDIDKAYSLGAMLFISKPEDLTELSKILSIIAMNAPEDFFDRLKDFSSVRFNHQ